MKPLIAATIAAAALGSGTWALADTTDNGVVHACVRLHHTMTYYR